MRIAPYREAFAITGARLFNVNVDVPHRVYNAQRLMLAPASISIATRTFPSFRICATFLMRAMSVSGSPPTLSWNFVYPSADT